MWLTFIAHNIFLLLGTVVWRILTWCWDKASPKELKMNLLPSYQPPPSAPVGEHGLESILSSQSWGDPTPFTARGHDPLRHAAVRGCRWPPPTFIL